MATHSLTIDRDLEDIEQEVRRELDTIQDMLIETGHRGAIPDWNTPYHLHRLRRALRIHYLALKLRDGTPVSPATDELVWDIPRDTQS